MHDGVMIECANKQLIKLGVLPSQSKDPMNSLKKKYTHLSEMVENLKLQNTQLQNALSTIASASPIKPRQPRAMLTAPDTDESQVDNESEENSDDCDSVDSHESSISSMANAISQASSKSKFKRKGSFKPKH